MDMRHIKPESLWKAVVSHPTNGEYVVRITAENPLNGRRIPGYPVVELPTISYEHAQAVVKAYNDRGWVFD
jgi:hypothetical protein